MRTFDFECDKCPFKSTGWPKANIRDRRAVQHYEEHDTGEPMQELGEFRKENGVTV